MTRVAKTFVHSDRRIRDSDVELIMRSLQTSLQRELAKTDVAPEESCCPFCLELFYDPVTLQCGHTSCKSCILRRLHCKICKETLDLTTPLSVNVALSSVIQKLHPAKFVGRGLTLNGERRMMEKGADDAILIYSEALHFDPFSHVACNNRAEAKMKRGNFTSALEDATQATNLAWRWPNGYLTKGEIFLRLENEEAAFVNFLMGLALDESQEDAKLKLKQIASKLLRSEYRSHFERDIANGGHRSHCDVAKISHHLPSSHFSSPCHRVHNQRHHSEHVLINFHSSTFQHSTCFPPVRCERPENRDKDEEKERMSMDESHTDASQSLLEAISFDSDCALMSRYNSICKKIGEQPEPFIKPVEPNTHEQSLHISDFECTLCLRLLFQPVCTPCGHMFCRECFERSMDYSGRCALCKSSISEHVQHRKVTRPSVDGSTGAIIKKYFPWPHNERLKQYRNKVDSLRQHTPIFVCTIAFPSVPCPLYVYEPRYRLMMRRVVDIHSNDFGVCSNSNSKPFHSIGTLVHVKNAIFYPDGRSIVECTGTKRFSVCEYSVCDGYYTAQVKPIEDEEITDAEQLDKLKQLLRMVYDKAKSWYKGLDPCIVTELNRHYGDFPDKSESLGENGPDWTWWVLCVLPVEDKIKLKALASTLLRERLMIILKVVICLQRKGKS